MNQSAVHISSWSLLLHVAVNKAPSTHLIPWNIQPHAARNAHIFFHTTQRHPPNTTNVAQQDAELWCMCAHTHVVRPFGQAVNNYQHSGPTMESTEQMCKHAWQSPHPQNSTHHKMSNNNKEKKTSTQSHSVMEHGFIYPVHRWSVLCRCKHTQHNEAAELNIDQWEIVEIKGACSLYYKYDGGGGVHSELLAWCHLTAQNGQCWDEKCNSTVDITVVLPKDYF